MTKKEYMSEISKRAIGNKFKCESCKKIKATLFHAEIDHKSETIRFFCDDCYSNDSQVKI